MIFHEVYIVYMYTISRMNSHEKEKGQYRIKFILIQFHG